MSRYIAVVSYDGTAYFGYQKQTKEKTIQDTIERVLSTILNENVKIFASGRTDAGVHAKGQTFHFDTEKAIDIGKFRYSMNCLLPNDIHILHVDQTEDTFHARLSAVAKKYIYQINLGEQDPFLARFTYHFGQTLDINEMQRAAYAWIGTHCFQNLTSKEEDEKAFVRTIYAIRFAQEENVLRITFIGDGFMRYMIRMMVGVLIAIGNHKEEVNYAHEILQTENRQITHYKAPPQGLTLERVFYPQCLHVNYHTHTKRCGHAVGEDEEYVQAAIKAGIRELGISDHIFYPHLKNDSFNHVRADYSCMEGYCRSFENLRKQYQSQIMLHIGFEAEYYPDYHEYYRSLLESKKVEYLILGQHFIREDGVTKCFLRHDHDVEGIEKYADALIAGMKTGFYRYVAHPDLFLAGYASFDEHAARISHRICSAAQAMHIPLEINLAGYRKGFHTYPNGERRFLYPHESFWKIAAMHGCQVVIGIDAHQPSDLQQKELFLAQELMEYLHLERADTSSFFQEQKNRKD